MEQVAYALAGAVAAYSAKSALFTAGYGDQGTFFDSTGSFTITLSTTSMVAGWSAWFRCISGTQTFDPSGTVTINGATTYAVSNAGDTVLVTFDGTNFVVAHIQRPSTVAISGGTIDGTAIGGVTPAAGAFTTGSFTGAVSLTTASSGLTISKTTGTTLVVSSTNAAAISCAGGFSGVSATLSSLTTGRLPLVSTAGLLIDNAAFTYDATALSPKLIVGDGTTNTTAASVRVNGPAASNRDFIFQTGSTSRWIFRVDNTAEGGANAGSDFSITALTDAGSTIDVPLSIARVSGGTATITRPVSLSTASSGLTISKTTGTTLVVSSTATACATFAGGFTAAGATVSLTAPSVILTLGDGTAAPTMAFNGAAGSVRGFSFATAGSSRWSFRAGTTAESGSDAGSQFEIVARNDSGTQIDVPITILRVAAGAITTTRHIVLPAATTGIPSIRLPHGTAPSSPTNGDMWTTTAGLYVRINGATVGPLS